MRYNYDRDGIIRMLMNGHSRREISDYYRIPYQSMVRYIRENIKTLPIGTKCKQGDDNMSTQCKVDYNGFMDMMMKK